LDIDADINNETKLAFIRLPQKINEDTWLTFWNFYVKKNKLLKNVLSELYRYVIDKELQHSDDPICICPKI
jgi:hypothetical protein